MNLLLRSGDLGWLVSAFQTLVRPLCAEPVSAVALRGGHGGVERTEPSSQFACGCPPHALRVLYLFRAPGVMGVPRWALPLSGSASGSPTPACRACSLLNCNLGDLGFTLRWSHSVKNDKHICGDACFAFFYFITYGFSDLLQLPVFAVTPLPPSVLHEAPYPLPRWEAGGWAAGRGRDD